MSLAAKRGNIRSAITKLITKLHDIDHNDDISDEEKIFELTAKLGSLQSKDAEARKYDDSILAACKTDKEIEDAGEEAAEVNEKTEDAFDHFSFKLSALSKKADKENASKTPSLIPIVPTHSSVSVSNLPKFKLPDFDGDILLWDAFFDVFESEVHNNTHYSAATKFNFLNSCLKGEAKSAVAGLSPNNENYPEAIAILQERYGQPKKVQSAYMRSLYSLENTSGDRESLRTFSDRLDSLIRGLEAQKVSLTGAFGDLIVLILLDKLSCELRRVLIRQNGSSDFDLDKLRKALKQEVEILDDSSD